jgi:hypothetical protein
MVCDGEDLFIFSVTITENIYVAMARSCSYDYQLWIHSNRDSGDYAKLSTKRSKKSIAVNVSINRGSADSNGICFFHT